MNKKLNMAMITVWGFIAALMVACSADYQTNFTRKTLVVPHESLAEVTFDLNGGSHDIKVETNVDENMWTATSNAQWCKIQKTRDKVTISADANPTYKHRVANVEIAYGHQAYVINVLQMGQAPLILVGEKNENDGYVKNIGPEKQVIDVSIKTNLDIDNVVIPDTVRWVHFGEITQPTRSDAVQKLLRLQIDQNTDTVEKFCSVILQSSANFNYKASFVIRQSKSGYLVVAGDSVKDITVPAAGKQIEIPFQINGSRQDPYRIEIEDAAKTWIQVVSKTRGLRNAKESFIIAPNIVQQPRQGIITFISKDNFSRFSVVVHQEAFEAVPPHNVSNPQLTPGAGYIDLSWSKAAVVDYTKIVISYYDPVAKRNVNKEITDNRATGCRIDDTYQAAGQYTFTIKSYGPTGVETETPVTVSGASLAAPDALLVPLTIDMISANETQVGDGGGLPALIDGNKETFYHSKWSGGGADPHFIQINLNEGIYLHHIEYNARHNGNGDGDVKRADILVADVSHAPKNAWSKLATIDFPLPSGRGARTVSATLPKSSSQKLYFRFTPTARRNADPIPVGTASNSWFNMADIFIFKYNPKGEEWARQQMQ